MSEITIHGYKANPGQHAFYRMPVSRLASGLELQLPLHILHGEKPGPRLMLTAVSHGDATTGFEVIRQVMEQVDLKELCGTIIAIPMQNPLAFEWDWRNTPLDCYNMNRTYPGNDRGWVTEQMAAVVSPFCDEADALIDWHGGGYGDAINYVLCKLGADEVDEDSLLNKINQMGKIFGYEFMYGGKPAGPAAAYAGSLTDYMICKGKPAIVAEVGTGLASLHERFVGDSVRGVFNVMKDMGMYPGKPVLPKTQWLVKTRSVTRPKNGGMFYPVIGPEYINRTVPKGTLIAVIRDPLSTEVIEEMRAPFEKTVFLDIRAMMTKVHPGDYAYIMADMTDAERFDNEAGA